MDLEQRVQRLELIIENLTKDYNDLKEEINNTEESEWKNNMVDDYMIKLVYPGIYCQIDEPTAAFPKNRRSVSAKLCPGQYMFIYAASPIKKIIGLTKVISTCKTKAGSRWPYYVDLEWVIRPKSGVSFSECDIDIRPRPGDTLYSINKNKANIIIQKLNNQKDLEKDTLDFLADQYKDMYEGK
ncbi:MAG: hypothetical protein ACRC6F_05495 [Aeromonas sp.]